MAFVYILESQTTKKVYIGSTNNINRRLIEHNSGHTKSIKNKGPWILKFKQYYEIDSEARKIEYKLKRFKNKNILDQIIKDGKIKTRCD